jgi:hypothetical protein
MSCAEELNSREHRRDALTALAYAAAINKCVMYAVVQVRVRMMKRSPPVRVARRIIIPLDGVCVSPA